MKKKWWKRNWWKLISVIFLLYVIIGGFLVPVPAKDILNESLRNLFFHVPMWMAMFVFFTVSFVFSIKHLRSKKFSHDMSAVTAANVGIAFGLAGIVTGAVWARFTWGQFWSNDPRQLFTAAGLLVYLAYFVLRNSFKDIDNRGKVAAVYNIFAYALLIPLMFILPRLADSLHPGDGGNPALAGGDSTAFQKAVLHPAFIGWTLLACWIYNLSYRIKKLKYKKLFKI